jgi:hypothetical protein
LYGTRVYPLAYAPIEGTYDLGRGAAITNRSNKYMNWHKLLFLTIWDEFKTLICLRRSSYQDVESKSREIRADNICKNIVQSDSLSSNSHTGENKQENAEQKHYTKEGWDWLSRQIVQVFTIVAVIIYFVQMQANRRQAEAAERQLKEMH